MRFFFYFLCLMCFISCKKKETSFVGQQKNEASRVGNEPDSFKTPVIEEPSCTDLQNHLSSLVDSSYKDSDLKKTSATHPYADQIYRATEVGIVSGEIKSGGQEPGFFNPGRKVNRAEMVMMFLEAMRCLKNVSIDKPSDFERRRDEYRAALKTEQANNTDPLSRTTYDDVTGDEPYAPRVYEATLKGIIRGFGNGRFYPDSGKGKDYGFVTYGQMCRMALLSIYYVEKQNPGIDEGRRLENISICQNLSRTNSEDPRVFPETVECLKKYSENLPADLQICVLGAEPTFVSRNQKDFARRDYAAVLAYRFRQAMIQKGYGLKCADPRSCTR